MRATLDISDGTSGRRWATLEGQSIGGLGRLSPRLRITFSARPARYTQVVLEDMTLRLEYPRDRSPEFIGEGRVLGVEVSGEWSGVTFEVVTAQRLLRYITDGVGPTTPAVELGARLSGFARVTVDENCPPEFAGLAADPGPGESKRITVSHGTSSVLQVSRSEWYDNVLSQTRNEQYRYLEIALPKDDEVLGSEWMTAVNHLVDAERAYAKGDDPAVFSYLKAAHDSLPGAKKNILDGISDANKRVRLDELLKKAGDFLHLGRHPSVEGTQQGTFPVDHLDAAFAIDLMRVLLSHLSLMLAAERRRAADLAR